MKTIQELVPLIHQWAKEREIYEQLTPFYELLKTHKEVGELIKACYDNDRIGIRDAIGDVMVTLINYCNLIGEDFVNLYEISLKQTKRVTTKTISAVNANSYIAKMITDEIVSFCKNEITYTFYKISDVLNELRLVTELEGTTLEACLNLAYNKIKDRTGRIINGKIIKDEK